MSRRMIRNSVMALGWFGLWVARLEAHVQAQPMLAINDVTVTETNAGTTVATFTVSFVDSTPHGFALVNYTTAGGTAATANQCAPGADFIGVTGIAGISFSATEYSKQINVTVCGDIKDEPDQTFFVNLTARGAVGIQDAQGQGTIVDDDPTPTIRITDVTVTEGAAGALTNATLSVTLAGPTENTATVSLATTNGSATGGSCGSPGADYQTTSSTLTLASPTNLPAQTLTQLVVLRVCGDDVSEGEQQFEVRLSNATNATIQDAVGLITITDDEPLPTLGITAAVQVNEPNTLVPQVDAVFTVALRGPPTEEPVTVQYATVPGTATGATTCALTAGARPGDYVTQTGVLMFKGEVAQQIVVPICADSVPTEVNETFTVTLTRAANAAIANAVGTATIR